MFLTLGITLVVALLVGLVMGGRPQRLADVRFEGMPVLLAGLVLGVLPLAVDLSAGANRALVAIANLIVLGFLALNMRHHRGVVRAGLALLATGWLLNAIVIAANGAMPLSRWAYERSGQIDPITAGEGGFFKIEEADASTRLRFLGDAIPVRPIHQVLSAGDLALILGIGVVLAGGMRQVERVG